MEGRLALDIFSAAAQLRKQLEQTGEDTFRSVWVDHELLNYDVELYRYRVEKERGERIPYPDSVPPGDHLRPPLLCSAEYFVSCMTALEDYSHLHRLFAKASQSFHPEEHAYVYSRRRAVLPPDTFWAGTHTPLLENILEYGLRPTARGEGEEHRKIPLDTFYCSPDYQVASDNYANYSEPIYVVLPKSVLRVTAVLALRGFAEKHIWERKGKNNKVRQYAMPVNTLELSMVHIKVEQVQRGATTERAAIVSSSTLGASTCVEASEFDGLVGTSRMPVLDMVWRDDPVPRPPPGSWMDGALVVPRVGKRALETQGARAHQEFLDHLHRRDERIKRNRAATGNANSMPHTKVFDSSSSAIVCLHGSAS